MQSACADAPAPPPAPRDRAPDYTYGVRNTPRQRRRMCTGARNGTLAPRTLRAGVCVCWNRRRSSKAAQTDGRGRYTTVPQGGEGERLNATAQYPTRGGRLVFNSSYILQSYYQYVCSPILLYQMPKSDLLMGDIEIESRVTVYLVSCEHLSVRALSLPLQFNLDLPNMHAKTGLPGSKFHTRKWWRSAL